MRTVLVLTATVPIGCSLFSGDPPEFPAGLEPIEENTASWPAPDGDDEYPEVLDLLTGEDGDGAFAHARGWIHAWPAEVWEALGDCTVLADQARLTEWSCDEEEPVYDVAIVVHNTVVDIITIDFDVRWDQGVVAGDEEAPEVVGVRFEKTEGSDLIDLMIGSVVLLEQDDDVTGVEIIERLDAATTGEDEVAAFVGDLYADLLAFVRGQDLPTYR